jgi:hypothetical protein
MGLLDDLKQQAQELKVREDEGQDPTQANANTGASAEQARRMLAPKMKALYNYFKEFNEHLNVVSPDVSGDYLLEGLGTLTNLRQGDYKLTTDDPKSIQKFTFHWSCSRSGRQEFKVANPILAEKHRETLWNLNLRFNKRDLQRGAGAVFAVDAYVPVSFEFEADPVKNVISLKLKNLGALGVVNHFYPPDKINAELMDELAKCVLRRPNRFDELNGEKMSDTLRQRLRENLEKERERRNTELHTGGGVQKSSVTQRLKGSLFRRKSDAK